MKIVFVHIPKAAGTSLKKAVSGKLGTDNIYFDYNRPLAMGDWQRNIRCLVTSITAKSGREKLVYGHFLVGKYAQFNGYYFQPRKKVSYAVFLRDPLQRAVSHFFSWKRFNVEGHRVWEQFIRENWSLERFLLSREHANFQSKFLWRFPLNQFDFIGLTEHFAVSLKMLGHTLPSLEGLALESENINPQNTFGVKYQVDPDLEAEFIRRNQQDYALYSQAVKLYLAQKSRLLKQASDND